MTVTGIYRATPLRVNPRMRNIKAVYKTYIDVVHFRKTDKRKLHERDADGYVYMFSGDDLEISHVSLRFHMLKFLNLF